MQIGKMYVHSRIRNSHAGLALPCPLVLIRRWYLQDYIHAVVWQVSKKMRGERHGKHNLTDSLVRLLVKQKVGPGMNCQIGAKVRNLSTDDGTDTVLLTY
jgi:hypothetical protein